MCVNKRFQETNGRESIIAFKVERVFEVHGWRVCFSLRKCAFPHLIWLERVQHFVVHSVPGTWDIAIQIVHFWFPWFLQMWQMFIESFNRVCGDRFRIESCVHWPTVSPNLFHRLLTFANHMAFLHFKIWNIALVTRVCCCPAICSFRCCLWMSEFVFLFLHGVFGKLPQRPYYHPNGFSIAKCWSANAAPHPQCILYVNCFLVGVHNNTET